jgi:hypothetical protein
LPPDKKSPGEPGDENLTEPECLALRLLSAFATLLAVLSGLLLLLTRLLLPAAALLATLAALLTTLVLTALAALSWILISHDLLISWGKIPAAGQRSSHGYVAFPEKRLEILIEGGD